jgi:hypothetical protein
MHNQSAETASSFGRASSTELNGFPEINLPETLRIGGLEFGIQNSVNREATG